jgi:hypothetical protein
MADLIHSRTTQQITASGLAGLFGLFALLCAVFAGCVTISDWHSETTQARWPVVSALVERADVVASARTPKDGGGTVWKLRYRVRYEQNGEALMATLTSRTAFSETDAAKLQSWAAQHRKVVISMSGLIHCGQIRRLLLRPNYPTPSIEHAPILCCSRLPPSLPPACWRWLNI